LSINYPAANIRTILRKYAVNRQAIHRNLPSLKGFFDRSNLIKDILINILGFGLSRAQVRILAPT